MSWKTKISKLLWLTFLSLIFLPLVGLAKPKIVTTSADLASVARYIGGDLAETEALVSGNTDLHYVSARPDFIRKVNKADVFVFIGLDMEVGWVPLLLRQSRNPAIQRGGDGHVDASRGVRPLDVSTGVVDRGMGDVHGLGNPHYWTDPVRVVVVARNILEALQKADAKNATAYQKNYVTFQEQALVLAKELEERFRPFRGRKIASYHSEFSYMAERFGFEVVGHIEERPGVAPSARYIRDLVDRLKAEKVRIIVNSPWANLSYSQRVARQIEAEHVILPIQVGSAEGTDDWFAMMRSSAAILLEVFEKTQSSLN